MQFHKYHSHTPIGFDDSKLFKNTKKMDKSCIKILNYKLRKTYKILHLPREKLNNNPKGSNNEIKISAFNHTIQFNHT